ncbi:hypothetical protein [Corynebacterium alimapuense]|uniref:Uncharacterized protein n=1 Tax=Corynebacterium alimapuense TaxID=1576874 RepID=A0A3M8K9D9_9CORY|nr:hypothetical protein [Corynebacterium alimapuense]RNE49134.1 hypothetical protein C5L39_01720 [Corynebacterium alimapuense]
MLATRMIPAMWLRLVVLIGFGTYVLIEQMWVIGAIAVGLLLLTIWQLRYAYRVKESDNSTE